MQIEGQRCLLQRSTDLFSNNQEKSASVAHCLFLSTEGERFKDIDRNAIVREFANAIAKKPS